MRRIAYNFFLHVQRQRFVYEALHEATVPQCLCTNALGKVSGRIHGNVTEFKPRLHINPAFMPMLNPLFCGKTVHLTLNTRHCVLPFS